MSSSYAKAAKAFNEYLGILYKVPGYKRLDKKKQLWNAEIDSVGKSNNCRLLAFTMQLYELPDQWQSCFHAGNYPMHQGAKELALIKKVRFRNRIKRSE